MDRFRRELEAFVREVYEGERKVLVFGEGPLHARVLLVGEAPGEREALEGRPFVGRAGKNLDAFLEGAHIQREELYVTNAVKFRPVRVSRAGALCNRCVCEVYFCFFSSSMALMRMGRPKRRMKPLESNWS